MALDSTSTDLAPVEDQSAGFTLPPAKPMAPKSALEQMVANPNIPGDLMTATQKELSSLQGMSTGIRAAQARAQKMLETVLDNEADGIKSKGESAINPQLDLNRMQQIVTPEQAAIYQDKREAYKRFYNATSGWDANTTYSKMQSDLEQLNPHNAPANSPAFSTHVQMYEDAQKRALEMDKVREKQVKDAQESNGRLFQQMMLPDNMRPEGIPRLSPEWLKSNSAKMKDDDIKNAAKYLAGGAEYSDRAVRDDLLEKSLYETPEDFRKRVFEAHSAHQLSNADEDHVMTVNKEAQTDVGVRFIRDAMDTALLGKDEFMKAELNSLRMKVIQSYLAERSAHPEWKDADRLNLAMRLERDNAIFDTKSMQIGLPITPFMQNAGATGRNSVTPEIVAQARALASAQQAAGRLNNYQALIEANNLKAWEAYFATAKKTEQARKDAAEATKRKAQ